MRPLVLKLIMFLCIWYEVAAELGLSGGTALVMALLLCGAVIMLLRLPIQILAVLGPRGVALVLPAAVWFGLAWWLMPDFAAGYPALLLTAGALLVLAGAAAHYGAVRYPEGIMWRASMTRGAIVPGVCVALGIANSLPGGLLALAVAAVVCGMPLRLGWRFIAPAAAAKFDARMGDAEGFRRAGFSDDA